MIQGVEMVNGIVEMVNGRFFTGLKVVIAGYIRKSTANKREEPDWDKYSIIYKKQNGGFQPMKGPTVLLFVIYMIDGK